MTIWLPLEGEILLSFSLELWGRYCIVKVGYTYKLTLSLVPQNEKLLSEHHLSETAFFEISLF